MVEAALDVALVDQLNLDGHVQEEIHQNLICSGLVWNRTLLVREVTSVVPSAMTIGASLVPFGSRRFWSQTGIDLVEGPQYSIYQKRDQKIEQTPGPGENDNYINSL